MEKPPEKSDKNNSSAAEREQLFYLPPDRKKHAGFRPQLISDEEKAIEEKGQTGFFWSRVWPSFKENPVAPIGLTLTLGALGYGVYCMGSGQQRKSHAMMNYRIGFQFITFVAIVGGYYRRDIKHSLMAKLEADAESNATVAANSPVTITANSPVTDSKK